MKRCPQCGKEYSDTVRFCTADGRPLEPAGGQASAPSVKAVVSEAPKPAPTPKTAPRPQIDGVPTDLKPQTDAMLGRVIAGRYRLLEKLGQGGMGAVYKGQHIRMHRLTAIKILTSDVVNNAEFVARFQREAEMASQIDHPNAVSIYDFGEAEDGMIYLAMEFVDGQPLSDILKREGPLPLDRVVRIIKQSADALGAAHALGIIHRDFKPDNIMVCDKPGRPDWVEVVDFGIAKHAAADPSKPGLTQVGYVLGTPLYMSPEQVTGEVLDQRSDLYSLALVAYEMLSGDLPFDGPTTQTKMVKRLLEPPRLISVIRPQLKVSTAVEAVILRALARLPNDRYTSTSEFAAELERAARSEEFTQPGRATAPPRQAQTPLPMPAVDTGWRPATNPNTPTWTPTAQPPTPPPAPHYSNPGAVPSSIPPTGSNVLVEILTSTTTKLTIIVLAGIYLGVVALRFIGMFRGTYLGWILRSIPVFGILLIGFVLVLLIQYLKVKYFDNPPS